MDLGLADATAAVIGRTKATLDNAVTDLTDRGSPDVVGLVADIGDTAQVEKVFAELSECWDSELSVLINTVGPGAPGPFEDLTDEQWRQSVEDGVLGMVRASVGHLHCWARRNGRG